jgi:hypothetical protein
LSVHRRNFSRLGFVSCLAVAMIGMLALAPTAGAQSAAADQYIELGPLGIFVEGNVGIQPAAGAGNEGNGAEGANAGGGTLPFTGYPLTTLILILLAMIATGVAIRLGLSAKDRLAMARVTSAGKRYR